MRGRLRRGSSRPKGALSVLLVEDDDLVRRVASEMLRSLGHEVVAAAEPDTALAAVAGERAVDVVLTDVVLPGENAPEFAERCRELRPGLRVVFMSGYAHSGAVERVVEHGERFIQKPFSRDELEAALRDAVS